MATYTCFRMRQDAEAMPDDEVVTAITLPDIQEPLQEYDSGVQECSTSSDNDEEQKKAHNLEDF